MPEKIYKVLQKEMFINNIIDQMDVATPKQYVSFHIKILLSQCEKKVKNGSKVTRRT